MFNIITKEIDWNGQKLKLETGMIARHTHGAVVVQMGETVVLCTVVVGNKAQSDLDFLALTINYQEKFYAAGKIPGGFIKRETKPSDAEALISRIIDRAMRPAFPKDYFHEIQVICTVLSYDCQNEPDLLALIGTSAAMWIAGLPIISPIAGVRVGYSNGELLCNPTIENCANSELELVLAGTSDSVFMIESEAKEISTEIMLLAIDFGQSQIRIITHMIEEFGRALGVNGTIPRIHDYSIAAKNNLMHYTQHSLDTDDSSRPPIVTKALCVEEINAVQEYMSALHAAFNEKQKQRRRECLDVVRRKILCDLVGGKQYCEKVVRNAIHSCESTILRSKILQEKQRVDGRGVSEVRKINCMLNLLPRTHGSALFTRGETQSLAIVTIGVTQDEQLSENLLGLRSDNFMLHYNFPPYSVGEVGAMRAPGRREIGHGKLAQKAVRAVMPSKREFGYAIRLVSEITESNGSSSMASVCSASLALMVAGVPIKKHVAGIAMGMIKEHDNFVILTDIMGDEDHLGDMDFKVASTRDGITALQMDIKVSGITRTVIETALKQAQDGIAHILDILEDTIPAPNQSLSKYAPHITQIKIQQDKIRDVIGTGGKIIKDICLKSGAKIEIDDSGIITIAAANSEATAKAKNIILAITAEPEVGEVYCGIVTKITDFGAFVKYFGETEGLLHISEIKDTRIANVSDHLREGESINVRLIGIDRNGKSRLSMRAVDSPKSSFNKGQVDKKNSKNSYHRSNDSTVLNKEVTHNCDDQCDDGHSVDSDGDGIRVVRDTEHDAECSEKQGVVVEQSPKRGHHVHSKKPVFGQKNSQTSDSGSNATTRAYKSNDTSEDVQPVQKQRRFF